MNRLRSFAKIAISVMGAGVFGVGLASSLIGKSGIPWRWLMFAESAIGVILSLMCAHYAVHGQMDATTQSTTQKHAHQRSANE